MSNIKHIRCNPRLQDLVLAGWPPCCATSFVVVVGPTRPRCMPLAIFTMRKELHGFLFLCMHVISSGRRSSAITVARAVTEPDMSRLFVGKKVGKVEMSNRWRLGHFRSLPFASVSKRV